MRIFLDTNVLAAALATRGLCAELFEVALQSHELLVSDSVLAELERDPGMHNEGHSKVHSRLSTKENIVLIMRSKSGL